jgi:hypothetical protein
VEYQGSLTLDSVQADLLARLQFYALHYKVYVLSLHPDEFLQTQCAERLENGGEKAARRVFVKHIFSRETFPDGVIFLCPSRLFALSLGAALSISECVPWAPFGPERGAQAHSRMLGGIQRRRSLSVPFTIFSLGGNLCSYECALGFSEKFREPI